jgi:class 3 adenylate cyclase
VRLTKWWQLQSMRTEPRTESAHLTELRLFVEEICYSLCRFQHVVEDGVAPEDVRIGQEVSLGISGAFADIRVTVRGAAPYFVEVKYGYPRETIIRHLGRKYGAVTPATQDATKVVLVVDAQTQHDWPDIESELRTVLRPGLGLEVWNEARLTTLIRERVGLQIDSIREDTVSDLRAAVDAAMGQYAFGDHYADDLLQSSLLWHFGPWRLREAREARQVAPQAIMPPRLYQGVAVLFADLCSYSSYVRDTADDAVVRNVLTSFYSKSRNQVLDTGGMLYQFQGDAVIALYGVPECRRGHVEDALACAQALVDIGNSTSNEWQRQIDHVQSAAGVHIGVALGDLQIVSLRPFAYAPVGAIADSINLAARLTGAAEPSEIVVSNAFFQRLPEHRQAGFQEMEPLEARHIGRVKAWRLRLVETASLQDPVT